MLTVACVLRSGGVYDEADVAALKRGVGASLRLPHRFLCLSDTVGIAGQPAAIPGCEWKLLAHPWPGWWSKINLFLEYGPLLYFDLDTAIAGEITQLAQAVEDLPPGRMMMLRGFYHQDRCSGIMGWTGNWRWLVDDFLAAELSPSSGRPGWTVKDRLGRCHGDQEWIAARMQDVVFAQDLAPGIVSYKVDVRSSGVLPAGTMIVCFHGVPKPRDLEPAPPWLQKSWVKFDLMERKEIA
jgi:hypothetical protein